MDIIHIPICFLPFIITRVTFIGETSCTSIDDPISFTQRSSRPPPLGSDLRSPTSVAYNGPEQRQKLCYYAKMAAGLPYIDNDYVPGWVRYYPITYTADFHYVMYCGTLPTMYVFLNCYTSVLQITTFRSTVENYTFDTEIITANFVVPTTPIRWETMRTLHTVPINESEEEDEMMDQVVPAVSETGASSPSIPDHGLDWRKFVSQYENFDQIQTTENRRYLCVEAQNTFPTPLRFLHYDVPEPQPYEFEDTAGSEKKIHLAISCPTLPKLYLRAGNTKEEIKLVLVRSSIAHYEYEVEEIKPTRVFREDEGSAMEFIGHELAQLSFADRMSLCAMARKRDVFAHVPFVQDANPIEAHWYTFEYTREPRKREVAILCPAIPSIYLRLDESGETNKLSITFPQTLADRYVYNVETIVSLNVISTEEEKESGRRKKSKMEAHPLVEMDEESRWSLCWTAQKRILNDGENRWKFRFASREPFLSDFRLLLIPKYMEGPRMYEINHLNEEKEDDMAIQCSAWPKMHVRLGTADNEVKIMLQEIRYYTK